MADTLFFDVETQRSFQEVGGRENLRLLRLSVAVTYNARTGEYGEYQEQDVSALLAELRSAELIVGFNLFHFDYEVLRAYTTEPLHLLPTVDMLHDIHQTLGFRLSLDSIADATLGVRKSADGLEAIRWFREGQITKLLAYCRQDVELTRRVFEYGCQHRCVWFRDKFGRKRGVPVAWTLR